MTKQRTEAGRDGREGSRCTHSYLSLVVQPAQGPTGEGHVQISDAISCPSSVVRGTHSHFKSVCTSTLRQAWVPTPERLGVPLSGLFSAHSATPHPSKVSVTSR